jgi:hypothetical protein
VLEVMALLYAALGMGAIPTSKTVVLCTVLVVVGLVFPLWALAALRSARAAAWFGGGAAVAAGNRPAWTVVADPLVTRGGIRLGALIMLIVGSIGVLATVLTVLSIGSSRGSSRAFYQWNLPALGVGSRAGVVGGAIVQLGVLALMIVGAALVLRGSRAGGRVLVAYAVGALTLSACTWHRWIRPGGDFTAIRSEPMMSTLNYWFWALSAIVQNMLWPGVVAAVFGLLGERKSAGATAGLAGGLPTPGAGGTAVEYSIE